MESPSANEDARAAVSNNDEEKLRNALGRGADANFIWTRGSAPHHSLLTAAARNGFDGCCRLLLARGPTASCTARGAAAATPRGRASRRGSRRRRGAPGTRRRCAPRRSCCRPRAARARAAAATAAPRPPPRARSAARGSRRRRGPRSAGRSGGTGPGGPGGSSSRRRARRGRCRRPAPRGARPSDDPGDWNDMVLYSRRGRGAAYVPRGGG